MLTSAGAVTALVTAVSIAPAVAAEVPLDEALREIGAACSQSRQAMAAGGVAQTSDGSRAVMSADRLEAVWSGRTRVLDAATGTYGPLSETGLSPKQQRAALRYLKRRSATHWFRSGVLESPASGLATTFDQARDEVVQLGEDCTRVIPSQVVATRVGPTWQFADAATGDATTVSLDDVGRVASWTGAGAQRSWTYGPQTVDLPVRVVPYAAWRKAAAAASLRATLRTIARSAAVTVNAATPTVDAIDTAVRTLAEQSSPARVKVRQLRKGSLIYARNRYTKTYHAWRVYLKGERAVARKVAP